MKSGLVKYAGLWIIAIAFVACDSEYTAAVKSGLSSGIVNDSLFFEHRMGDTKKEFYDHCWQLNKEQKISQGSGNQYAKYIMEPRPQDDSLSQVIVLFYGIFDEQNIMNGMEMKMTYYSWSPWNSKLGSTSLMDYVSRRYTDEYPGNEFMEVEVAENLTAKVKIDGNRQITMYPLDDKEIMVKIEDLRSKNLL